MSGIIPFATLLDRTIKTIQQKYIDAFQEYEVDLTIEQWVILNQIYDLGDHASQQAITNLHFRNRATISRIIGKLTKKGLVIKNRFEGDQKRYKLSITPDGIKIIESFLPYAIKLRKLGHKNIKDEEFEIFLKVNHQIWQNYAHQKED